MALFGGFNIVRRRPDTSSLDNALRMYAGYKANKSNNEATIEKERIKAEAELRKALLKAEADAAKAAAKAGDKGKLDPTKFVQSLMSNYPQMTKEEAIGLYGQLLSGSQMYGTPTIIDSGSSVDADGTVRPPKQVTTQTSFDDWKQARIKKLTKVQSTGGANPYKFVDGEGNEVTLSKAAYDYAMKNDTEGKVYVASQGKWMSEGEAEGWALRTAKNVNKVKPSISGVDDGSDNVDSNSNDSTNSVQAITFDFSPRSGESKVAYQERMKSQREMLKIGATGERDEAKYNNDLHKANVKFELDMRKAGLYKATRLDNGKLTVSVNPLGEFDEDNTWVRKDTAGNLYESDINEKQAEMRKAYDLWREDNLVKPREDRTNKVKEDNTLERDEEALRKEAVSWYQATEANKKKMIEKYDVEYAKFTTTWGKGRSYTPVRDWQNVVDIDDTFRRFTTEYKSAMNDPLRNQQEVVDKYKQLYPGLFDYTTKIKDTQVLSEYDRVGRLSKNYTSTKSAPTRDEWYKHAKLIDLTAKGRDAEEVIRERIEERKKLLGKSIAPDDSNSNDNTPPKSNSNNTPNLDDEDEDENLMKLMEVEGWGNQ